MIKNFKDKAAKEIFNERLWNNGAEKVEIVDYH